MSTPLIRRSVLDSLLPRVLTLLSGSLMLACSMEAGESGEESVQAIAQPLTFNQRLAGCQDDPRVLAGLVSVETCVGADIFFRETFEGNGRTCSTCHRVENDFTIDSTFIATLPSDDPLFVAEFDPALANLERPAIMRSSASALILENVDGVEPDPNVRFTLRSTPHTWSMGTSVTRPPDGISPPVDRTGWSGDGAPGQGRLKDFSTGAVFQHATRSLDRIAGVDFRLPDDNELNAVTRYLEELGRTNDLWLPNTFLTDAGAESGRQLFLGPVARCNNCHQNAGANSTIAAGGNRNFNTGVESARSAALAGIPVDGGFLATPANPDGSFGDGTFNSTPLVEAADTGPFFHTDTSVSGASAHDTPVATTIEQAIAFYDSPAFAASPAGQVGPIDLTATQIDQLGRFLRVVNAAFNVQVALERLDAALELANHFQNDHLAMQRQMLALARIELDDAIDVLNGAQGGPLNAAQRQHFQNARSAIDNAIATNSAAARQNGVSQARNTIWDGFIGLGAGLDFVIGPGTIMF